MAIPLGPGNVLGELRWNLDGLNAKLDAYAKTLHANLAEAVVKTAFRLEARFKAHPGGTPRDTGRAANSWHVVRWGGSPGYAYKDDHGKSYDGTTSQSPARDTEAIVASAVIYMLALEAGWSKQAPAGFIRRNTTEMQQEFLAAVAAAKAKTKV